jgi:pentatricopeptide repeat protein
MYNAVITACASSGDLEVCLQVLSHMRAGNPAQQPDIKTYSTAMRLVAQCGRWQDAVSVLTAMSDTQIAAPLAVYTDACKALYVSHRSLNSTSIPAQAIAEHVLQLLCDMLNNSALLPNEDVWYYVKKICAGDTMISRLCTLLVTLTANAPLCTLLDDTAHSWTINHAWRLELYETVDELYIQMYEAGLRQHWSNHEINSMDLHFFYCGGGLWCC